MCRLIDRSEWACKQRKKSGEVLRNKEIIDNLTKKSENTMELQKVSSRNDTIYLELRKDRSKPAELLWNI